MKCEINPSTIKQPLSYVVMVILSGSFIIKINKRKKMQSHTITSLNPLFLFLQPFPAPWNICTVLSLRLKPTGNDILIGNIRNGTQPLHLLASRPQHMPFSWTFGWRDQGFYPAWVRIQAPNPSATFLTLLSHGTLHQRFVCCSRLFWTSVVLFSCLLCLLLTPICPLSHPDSQRFIIFRLSSISSARQHKRQVGVRSEATMSCGGLSDDSV